MKVVKLGKVKNTNLISLKTIKFGMNDRTRFKLNSLDSKDEHVSIVIPEYVKHVSCTYIIGLLIKSYNLLRNNFEKHYTIICSPGIRRTVDSAFTSMDKMFDIIDRRE